MRICLVSSSFYPAIFYGGPISSTWDLSKKIGEKNIEVYVSTTNADGDKRLKDVDIIQSSLPYGYDDYRISDLGMSFQKSGVLKSRKPLRMPPIRL